MSTHVLVTGATGFIGQILCRELHARGFHVLAMTRSPRPGPWQAEYVCDLGKTPVDPQALTGVETIFHLAGKAHVRAGNVEEIREYDTVHVAGTRDLLLAARQAGVHSCVLLSSVKSMGEGGATLWDEATPCAPQNPYGATKLRAEELVLRELPLPCSTVLRPALVYGPGGKGNLDLLIRAARKRRLPRVRFPANARSMIHVRDVARACILAANHPAACGQTYILTDGREYATNDLWAWIHDALGKTPHLTVPFPLLRALAACGDLAERFGAPSPLTTDKLRKLAGSARYSNAKIRRELGFTPQWDLRMGIREMVAHLENQ